MTDQTIVIINSMFGYAARGASSNPNVDVIFTYKVKPMEGAIYMPAIFGNTGLNRIKESMPDINTTGFILSKNAYIGDPVTRRTFVTILKSFYSENAATLAKVETNKEDVYYGNKNIILDSTFTPLFVPAYSLDLMNDTVKRVLLLNPVVLTRKDILCNNLRRDVLPYLASNMPVVIRPLHDLVTKNAEVDFPHNINRSISDLSRHIALNLRINEG